MKNLLIIFFLFLCYNVVAQNNPSGVPTQFSTGWFRHGWDQSDSGKIFTSRAPNFTPRFPGTVEFYQDAGIDSLLHLWTGGRWLKLIPGFDSTSLSNRINLKLNIADTTNKWWGVGKRWVDTVYRVNDSTVGFTVNGGAQQTFEIKGGASGAGGSGTVTSVGLSLPSAFSVTPSTITTSGTFNISGAGTTAQYIRGNGTLATTDTGMIPNFTSKVRNLFSSTSPISYNSSTGTFSLDDVVSAGACTNCNLTIDAKGRVTLYSNGSTSGVAVDTLFRTPGVDSIYFTVGGVQYAIKDSTGSLNISNASLTANGDYSQNWSNKQWYVDSIGGQFLFRMGGVGNTGTRRKEFRINWGGPSFGDNLDGYNMFAVVKKADNSGDSLRLGLISSGAGTLSMGAYDVGTSANNTFISYSHQFGLINISAKDSIWIKGAVPAATADSILGVVLRGSNGISKIVKIPISAAITSPASPNNSVQINIGGSFGADSLFVYPSDNKIVSSHSYIQYGRPGTGFFTSADASSSSGYLWKLYPRGSGSTGADTLDYFYSELSTTKYDAGQPENPVLTIFGMKKEGEIAPRFSMRIEDDFYDDYEFHLASTPRNLLNPNDETRHWSWNIGRENGQSVLATRSDNNYWAASLVGSRYNQQYATLSPAGLTLTTWQNQQGSISVLNGNGASTSVGIGLIADTVSMDARLYATSNATALYLSEGIIVDNPANATSGTIGISKNTNINAKTLLVTGTPAGFTGFGVQTALYGYIFSVNADGSGFGATRTAGTFSIDRDAGMAASTKMYLLYQNNNPVDSLWSVNGYGSIWTKGFITSQLLKTTLTPPVTVGTTKMVVVDTLGRFSWEDIPGGSATTIYNGDGTLAGDRTVTGSNNSLTLNGLFNFRVNANSMLQSKTGGGATYSTSVLSAANFLQFGYTPVPTVYSKGSAIIIDTNNNVGLGTSAPTTMPLYATGTNAVANNLMVGGSQFDGITTISSNTTLDLFKYYVRIDASGGNVTVTLPAASTGFGSSLGIHYVFKRIDNSGNSVTVQRAGSDTIDGGTSITLTTQYEVKEIICSSSSTWDVR